MKSKSLPFILVLSFVSFARAQEAAGEGAICEETTQYQNNFVYGGAIVKLCRVELMPPASTDRIVIGRAGVHGLCDQDKLMRLATEDAQDQCGNVTMRRVGPWEIACYDHIYGGDGGTAAARFRCLSSNDWQGQ